MKNGVLALFSLGVGTLIGSGVTLQIEGQKEKMLNATSNKNMSLYLMMNQWVRVKQAGKNLTDYFKKKGYKNIAVYGMSNVGETLIDELKGTDTCIKYGIDMNASNIHLDIPVFSLNDEFEDVDAIVVTPIFYFDDIEETLSRKMKCPIISLEDILYEV